MTAKEIIELINIVGGFNDKMFYGAEDHEIELTRPLIFSTMGSTHLLTVGDTILWDSENDDRKENEAIQTLESWQDYLNDKMTDYINANITAYKKAFQ